MVRPSPDPGAWRERSPRYSLSNTRGISSSGTVPVFSTRMEPCRRGGRSRPRRDPRPQRAGARSGAHRWRRGAGGGCRPGRPGPARPSTRRRRAGDRPPARSDRTIRQEPRRSHLGEDGLHARDSRCATARRGRRRAPRPARAPATRCRRSGVTGNTPSVIASSCDLRAAIGVRRSCATSAAHWPRSRSSSTRRRWSTFALSPILSSSRGPPPAKTTPRSPAPRRVSPAASSEAWGESRDENRNATPRARRSATPAPAPPTTARVRRKSALGLGRTRAPRPRRCRHLPPSRSSTGTASVACRGRSCGPGPRRRRPRRPGARRGATRTRCGFHRRRRRETWTRRGTAGWSGRSHPRPACPRCGSWRARATAGRRSSPGYGRPSSRSRTPARPPRPRRHQRQEHHERGEERAQGAREQRGASVACPSSDTGAHRVPENR